MEAAARGRVERAWDFATDGQLFVPFVRMRRQSCGKQSLRVRVERLGAQFEAVGELDDLPKIHDGDTVADMGYRGQIMADEEIADPQCLLQMLEALANSSCTRARASLRA